MSAPVDSFPQELRRARFLLLGVFGLGGLMAFAWLARLPSIRDGLGVSPAELGVILLVGSIGALVTVFSSSVWLPRFGTVPVFRLGTVAASAGLILMGLGPELGSVWVFGWGVVINGIGGSLIHVPMNVESTRIEHAYRRSVIPQFHAAFSIGAVAGSLLGAGSSWAGIGVGVQFATLAVLIATGRLLAAAKGMALPDSESARAREDQPAALRVGLRVWLEPRTILIGIVAFAAALSEGAANNWLAVSMVDGFATTESIGGLALGVFIGVMTVGRMVGSRWIDRFGRVRSLQASGAAAITGVVVFSLASNAWLALGGIALWGAGAALGFPIAIAAASDDPSMAAARVPAASSMASVAVLAAAPVVGMFAGVFGSVRLAMLVVLGFLAGSILIAPRLSPEIGDADAELGEGEEDLEVAPAL